MSEMMKPESKFTFGKYKGKTINEVAGENPGYLCWMRRTGFQQFGKEVTEAIFAWEELNPEEVLRIDRSIAKKRAEAAKADNAIEEHAPITAPVPQVAASANLAWGSW